MTGNDFRLVQYRPTFYPLIQSNLKFHPQSQKEKKQTHKLINVHEGQARKTKEWLFFIR